MRSVSKVNSPKSAAAEMSLVEQAVAQGNAESKDQCPDYRRSQSVRSRCGCALRSRTGCRYRKAAVGLRGRRSRGLAAPPGRDSLAAVEGKLLLCY